MNALPALDGRLNETASLGESSTKNSSPRLAEDLLTKQQEFNVSRRIDRYRTAFRRRVLREVPVLNHLLELVVECAQGNLREDMLFDLTLRELEKRKKIQNRISKVRQLLENCVERQGIDRQTWLELVRQVEGIEIRFRYFENSPFQDTRARQLLAEYKHSVQHLAAANLRLVVSICGKICRTNKWQADLIQEGFRGLMMAVQKFDYRRNIRFSTYATPWIRKAILEALPNQHRLIKLPERIRSINQKWLDDLHTGHAGPVASEELACSQLNGCSYTESVRYVRIQADVQSLDRSAEGAGGMTLCQLLADPVGSATQQVEKRELVCRLRTALSRLGEPEQAVIMHRFGIIDGATKSLAAVGRRLRFSREHVRQLEKSALKKLAEMLGVGTDSSCEIH